MPEWAAAQTEFLALKNNGDRDLLAAARQRLRLSGMPPGVIAQVERSGKIQPYLTLTSPIGGVLQELNLRIGMTVAAGETLARVNGLSSVWLAVSVPESDAGTIAEGQKVEAQLPASLGSRSMALSAQFCRTPCGQPHPARTGRTTQSRRPPKAG